MGGGGGGATVIQFLSASLVTSPPRCGPVAAPRAGANKAQPRAVRGRGRRGLDFRVGLGKARAVDARRGALWEFFSGGTTCVSFWILDEAGEGGRKVGVTSDRWEGEGEPRLTIAGVCLLADRDNEAVDVDSFLLRAFDFFGTELMVRLLFQSRFAIVSLY